MRCFLGQTNQWLKYGLFLLLSLISILQWQAVVQEDHSELFATNLLVFLGISSLLWDKRQTFSFQSTWGSSLLGFTLILLVLLRSLALTGYNPRISLLIALVGLSLLASGFRKFRDYWAELAIASWLIVDPILVALLKVLDLPLITASVSTTVLSLLGFTAQQKGHLILLPTGRVEVYGVCSGIQSIVQMLNLAFVLALVLPASIRVKQISFILAPLLGFSVNALRIALLTFLIADSNMAAFHYWHDDPNASLVFFLIASALLMAFYYGCLQYLKRNQANSL